MFWRFTSCVASGKNNVIDQSLSPEASSLVTKGSTVQKISSGQTLIDLKEKKCCDLDLDHSNQIFS